MLCGEHRSARRAVMPLLIAIARNRNLPDSDRLTAISAFRYAGPAAETAVPALVEAMKNPSAADARMESAMRIQAFEALGCIGPGAKAAVPELIKFFEDEKQGQQERRMAMAALWGIGPAAKDAIPALTRMTARKPLSLEDRQLIRQAEVALESIRNKGPGR
jgi:HEAT repeat protein